MAFVCNVFAQPGVQAALSTHNEDMPRDLAAVGLIAPVIMGRTASYYFRIVLHRSAP